MNSEDVIQRSVADQQTYLGSKTSRYGFEELVGVADSDRLLHTAVTGPTGQGKTNLLLWIALQDGHKTGFTMLNPEGGIVDHLICRLPEERLEDVIYINPGRDRVPGINVLEPVVTEEMTRAERNRQQRITVSSIMGMFRRLTEEWGERWPRNLRSLVSVHVNLSVHHGEQNTLLDLYRCVTEPETLDDLIKRASDDISKDQLEELRRLSPREKEPLKRRLSDLVENETVRRVIAQRESSISFQDALSDRKILLVDIQSGQIGNWAARIIGSVVLTQLWSATAARSSISPSDRVPHHILIDEVQEFISEADHLRRMLAQCREYNVSVTSATQYLDDLDTTMKQALLNNTLTKVVFTPGGSKDLNTFTTIMNGLSKGELSRLGQYRPAVQFPAEQSLPPAKVIDTYPPWNVDPDLVEQRKQRLLDLYREPTGRSPTPVDLGDGANAGGERHRELLTAAENQLEENGYKVDLLDQDAGSDIPDGRVTFSNGDTAHLEAESGTLSKPGKVLKNLHRAALQDRETIFVVEEGDAQTLENILSDPVNRDGSTGEFSYYKLDGEPFDAVDEIEDAEYRIIEISADRLNTQDADGSEPGDEKEGLAGKLREEDRTVLNSIKEGRDDIHKITSTTDLDNGQVNYCFRKLVGLDLIEIENSDGMVERYQDGQRRVFEAPKRAWLTPQAEQFLDELE